MKLTHTFPAPNNSPREQLLQSLGFFQQQEYPWKKVTLSAAGSPTQPCHSHSKALFKAERFSPWSNSLPLTPVAVNSSLCCHPKEGITSEKPLTGVAWEHFDSLTKGKQRKFLFVYTFSDLGMKISLKKHRDFL